MQSERSLEREFRDVKVGGDMPRRVRLPPPSLRPHGLQPAGLLCPWAAGGGGRAHLLGDLPTPGIEPRSL